MSRGRPRGGVEQHAVRRHRAPVAASTGAARIWRRALVIALLGLALAVRLREPMSTLVIGAEDPYLHMARAWDVAQGRGLPSDYPPGFAILLAPFTFLGPTAFYAIARFLPPLLGVVQVLGVYLLARENLRTPAALVAATLVALMPENIFRTNLLFPTALDLALLPFFLLHLLRAVRGERPAIAWAIGLAALLGVVHPWVLVYLLPPTLAAGVLALRTTRSRRAVLIGLAALALVGVVFAFLPGTWNPTHAFVENAGPRALELVTNPASFFPLPLYVDSFPYMVGWAAIALAAVGAVAALVRRTPLGIVALVYTLAIVPFVFVDWFDVWFIPHRSVAYLSIGLALLAAIPVELMGVLPEWSMGDVAAAAVIGSYLVLTMAPVAMTVDPWYRLYDEDDYEAWRDIDRRGAELVVTGSWQSAVGYRAITGEDSLFNPDFFRSAETRRAHLETDPGLVVLLDEYARDDGFHAPGGWREVGRWGDTRAYAPP